MRDCGVANSQSGLGPLSFDYIIDDAQSSIFG